MRQDQYEKLQALAEQLTDVFLLEADPTAWPGAGIKPNAMDKATRGDRVWVKKDAAGTAVLIMKVTSMVGMIQRGTAAGGAGGLPPSAPPTDGSADPSDDDDTGGLDAEIAAAEREAAAVLDRVQKRLDQRG
ncbi:hypothetical protein [Pigmentiphaga sp. CHJ604]|uniref:hypothetical protein n=1 Tax=Pigmentiphaga sp. CHJ604 TaxID=3081984 RepID=UPI0030CBF264